MPRRYPPDHDALRACLESERPLAIVQAQTDGAAVNGIAATPTLHLRDERSGQSLWLQGPIPGDALLSVMERSPASTAQPSGEHFMVLLKEGVLKLNGA